MDVFYGFLFLALVVVSAFFYAKKKLGRKRNSTNTFICPIRKVREKKYDSNGKYRERYYTKQLAEWLIKKGGYGEDQIGLEDVTKLGNDGRNSLRPDLIIVIGGQKDYYGKFLRDEDDRIIGKCLLVAEVKKKNLGQGIKKKAVRFQLNIAMRLYGAKYGIFYDGDIAQSEIRKVDKNGNITRFSNFPPSLSLLRKMQIFFRIKYAFNFNESNFLTYVFLAVSACFLLFAAKYYFFL